ncbi:MAG: SIS domain-containing protein [Alphaproteobacteria bacterium]|nr:SIS domain-containing protein [Alphaproteobacteria bacterium]
MTYTQADYAQTHTFKEIEQAFNLVAGFDWHSADLLRQAIEASSGQLHIAGIGSSVNFPVQNFIHLASRSPETAHINVRLLHDQEVIEASHENTSVLFISNSGATGEIIDPAKALQEAGHPHLYAMTTLPDSSLAQICGDNTILLACDKENAIAATKTVLGQALLLQATLFPQENFTRDIMQELSAHLREVFETGLEPELIERLTHARSVRLVGTNDGAMKELNLKLTEACSTRERPMNVHHYNQSEILHGPHQGFFISPEKDRHTAQDETDIVLLFDPPENRQELLQSTLENKTGVNVWAIASQDTVFKTIQIPQFNRAEFRGYTKLVAGWKLMMEIAQAKQIPPQDLDKPARLTKVVNAH